MNIPSTRSDCAAGLCIRRQSTVEEKDKGVMVSPPVEFEGNCEATSALCEHLIEQKILSEVVVILRFGFDAQALFNKLPALTSHCIQTWKSSFISSTSSRLCPSFLSSHMKQRSLLTDCIPFYVLS